MACNVSSRDSTECRHVRTLRRWSVWGCALGLLIYAALWRVDAGLTSKLLITRVLIGICYGLIGIAAGRLLATLFYDTEG